MKLYLDIIKKEKWLITVVISIFAFSFILVTTLNFTIAVFSFAIFSGLAIFQKSFHQGLAFFLIAILIFPATDVIPGILSTREIFVIFLATIGIITRMLDKVKISVSKLFYYWGGLIFLSTVSIIFSIGEASIIYVYRQAGVDKFIIVFLIYPMIIISVQYFFQTTRRLEKLFLVIIFIGFMQSVAGVILFSGFFEITQEAYLSRDIWATLMISTIPITLGMWLLQNNSLSTLKFSRLAKKKNNISKIVDVVSVNKRKNISKKAIVDLKRFKSNIKMALMAILMLQVFSLMISSSCIYLIAVGGGIFIIGVLMRNRRIIWSVLILLLGFSIALSGSDVVCNMHLKQGVLDLVSVIKSSQGVDILWKGIAMEQYQSIGSSYEFIFSRLGLLGVVLFVATLVQYFKETRNAYLKSDGFERIWLMIVLAILMEFMLLGFLKDVFFAWPAALIFWLLYGVLQNLKGSKKEFSLIDTKLDVKL